MRNVLKYFLVAICFCFTGTAYANLPEIAPGAKAPMFELLDTSGKSVKLSDYSGKVIVLEWTNPKCPFVVRHYNLGTMNTLAQKFSSQGVVWLTINSTHFIDSATLADWAKEKGIIREVLDDSAGVVGKLYGARTTPHMFIVDAHGNVAYNGAIDDDADGENSKPNNYVENALNEVLAGKDVTVKSTKPYGCSVKYR